MKIALVELYVDLTGMSSEDKPGSGSELIRQRIKDTRQERLADVLAAIAEAKKAKAAVVLFPGWTLFGRVPPRDVLAASAGIIVVFEMFDRVRGPKKKALTWAVKDGAPIHMPIEQRLATGGEVQVNGALTSEAVELARDVCGGSRDLRLSPKRKSLLLVCGEINIVGGGAEGGDAYHREALVRCRPALSEERLSGYSLVLNPAHTWMGPNATREKRKWLSKNGTLVTTANTHSGYWGRRKLTVDGVETEEPHRKNAKKTAARAYRFSENDDIAVAVPLAANPRVSIAYANVP